MKTAGPGIRTRAGSAAAEAFFQGLSAAGKLHPLAKLARHGLERIADVPYVDGAGPDHWLDVYRPRERTGPCPVVLYVHGGGFRILSKETHWLMGLLFARSGYVVFNINYRLAPQHPFPAAIEDTCRAFEWVLAHAHEYGGDVSRIAFAGESAGANLVTALTLATCFERPEPYAARVWRTGVVPKVVLPACGIYQVSDPLRFGREKKLSRFVADRVTEVCDGYLPDDSMPHAERVMADVLPWFESDRPAQRSLPPFYLPVGTKDPLLPDTRRLAAALRARGVDCVDRYFPGEIHAFHALFFRRQARQCWREMLGFAAARIQPTGEK